MELFLSKERHFDRVHAIQKQLQQSHQLFCLKAGSSNTLRSGDYKDSGAKLDLSQFTSLLEFNPDEAWILVEPRITFYKLCRYTLSKGFVPLVVPEFKAITVGGAVMGAALESSSHRYGQFNDTCLEYECILGNGELIYASPTQNADLFYACSGSYGTLTILTAVKIKLRAATGWIRLTVERTDAFGAVERLTTPRSEDFSEAIVYQKDHAAVLIGTMTKEPEKKKIFRQHRPWSPWYVQQILHTKNSELYMTHEEYLFRLDRGAFWIGRYAHSFLTMCRLLLHLGIPKVKEQGTFSPRLLFRLLFGWAFSSAFLYSIWHRIPNSISEQLFFIHDFYTPWPQAKEALADFMQETAIFPIWLCPIKGSETPQFLAPHFGKNAFLNIGLYGVPKKQQATTELSARLEKKILEYGGRKMLYSFTYYSKALFEEVYSQEKYAEIRKKYHAERAFPALYQKVSRSSP